MAGVGLGTMCQAFLGYMLIIGLNASVETFVSQASGAKNMHLCGVYLNRGRFIMTCAFIPATMALLYIEPLLVHLGQDPEISAYAQQYVKVYMPGLYLQLFNDLQRKFLNSLGKNAIPLISQCIATVFHVLFSYIFITYLGYGIIGTGISGILTNSITCIVNLVYSYK